MQTLFELLPLEVIGNIIAHTDKIDINILDIKSFDSLFSSPYYTYFIINNKTDGLLNSLDILFSTNKYKNFMLYIKYISTYDMILYRYNDTIGYSRNIECRSLELISILMKLIDNKKKLYYHWFNDIPFDISLSITTNDNKKIKHFIDFEEIKIEVSKHIFMSILFNKTIEYYL